MAPASHAWRKLLLVRGSSRSLPALNSTNEENNRSAEKAGDREITQIVHIGVNDRLNIHGVLERCVLSKLFDMRAGAIKHFAAQRGMKRVEEQPASRHVTSQIHAMHLRVARHDGVDHGNADATADVAQQVVQAAGVADLLVR